MNYLVTQLKSVNVCLAVLEESVHCENKWIKIHCQDKIYFLHGGLILSDEVVSG